MEQRSTGRPAHPPAAAHARPETTHPGDGRDEVDRITDAWARERPDLETSPLHVFSRVSRLARHLDLARRRTFAAHALELWEFDVLSALRRSGEPYELTPGRLMTETLVSSGTMTNRIDRMVKHGLVLRAAGPADRRVVLVRLTPLGKQRVDAALADLLTTEQVLLEELDETDRLALQGLLRRLLLPLDAG